MSGYIPGAGLKKSLNLIETPIYPDIKKAPPRFLWTKKNWHVDTGRTVMEIEHNSQLNENAILFQSYDYNSQHLYGKRPTYDVFVNKEFRPPLQDRDDFLPLSRIPRPPVVPRINPGTANPSGNNPFEEQNFRMPGVDKHISDRVKHGDIRPTFFAPLEMPTDNSVLPDLEMKLPPTSASAGYAYPTIAKVQPMQTVTRYKDIHSTEEYEKTPITIDAGIKNVSNVNSSFMDREIPDINYEKIKITTDAKHNPITKHYFYQDDVNLNTRQKINETSIHNSHRIDVSAQAVPEYTLYNNLVNEDNAPKFRQKMEALNGSKRSNASVNAKRTFNRIEPQIVKNTKNEIRSNY